MKLSKNSYIRYCDVDRYSVVGVDGWTVYSTSARYTGSPVTYITASEAFGTRSTVTHNSDIAYRTFFVTNSTISSATLATDVHYVDTYGRRLYLQSHKDSGVGWFRIDTSFTSQYRVAVPTSVALAWMSSDLRQAGWGASDIEQLSYVWDADADVVTVSLGDDAPIRYISDQLYGGANTASSISSLYNTIYGLSIVRKLPEFALSCVQPAAGAYDAGTCFLFRLPDTKHTIGNATYTVISHISVVGGAGADRLTAYHYSRYSYTVQHDSTPVVVPLTATTAGYYVRTFQYNVYPQRLPARFTFTSNGTAVSGLQYKPRGLYWITSGVTSFPVDAHTRNPLSYGGLNPVQFIELVGESSHYVMLRNHRSDVTCSAGVYTINSNTLASASDVTVNVADFVMADCAPPLLSRPGDVPGRVLADDAAVNLSNNLQIKVHNTTRGAKQNYIGTALGDRDFATMLINIPTTNSSCSQYKAVADVYGKFEVYVNYLRDTATRKYPKITTSMQSSWVSSEYEMVVLSGGSSGGRYESVRYSSECSETAIAAVAELEPSVDGSFTFSILQHSEYEDGSEYSSYTHAGISTTYEPHTYFSSYYVLHTSIEPVLDYTRYCTARHPSAVVIFSDGRNPYRLPFLYKINNKTTWLGSEDYVYVELRYPEEHCTPYATYDITPRMVYSGFHTCYSDGDEYSSGYTGSFSAAGLDLDDTHRETCSIACLLPLANSVYTIIDSYPAVRQDYYVDYEKYASGSVYLPYAEEYGTFKNCLAIGWWYSTNIYGYVYSQAHKSQTAYTRFVDRNSDVVRVFLDVRTSLINLKCVWASPYYSGVIYCTEQLNSQDFSGYSTQYTSSRLVSAFRAATPPALDEWLSEFKESVERFTAFTPPESWYTDVYSHDGGYDWYKRTWCNYGYLTGCAIYEYSRPEIWHTYTCMVTVATH